MGLRASIRGRFVSVTSVLCLAAGCVTSCQPALTDYQPLHDPPPQRNPVPSHPLCPMSSVSAWSTAAAVRGTTARAIHESPVISAEIDDEVLDFSAVFPVDTEFLPFSGKGEGEKAVPSFDIPCPVLSFLMRILEIYGAGFFKTAGLSCPSTI